MNLRWLLGNFTDPEFGLTPQQQREVTRLAHRKYLSSKRLALWTIGLTLVCWLALGFGWELLTAMLNTLRIPWSRWLSLIVICLAAIVFAAWMYRFIYTKPVRLAMRELHYDLCVECGYRLEGLDPSMTQCPECGANREIIPSENKP